MLPPRNVKHKGTQLSAFISDDHARKLAEIWDFYKNAHPLSRVRKYKVIETIIDDHYKLTFTEKSSQ